MQVGLTRIGATIRAAGRFGRRVTSDWMGVFGLSLSGLVVLTGIFARWLTPYDPVKISIAERMAGPSWAHPLGTDQLGRDLLSRVIEGSQIAILVAGPAISISLMLGTTLGLLAGYGPRRLDNVLVVIFDAVYSFPTIMLGLAVVTLLGPSLGVVIVVIVAAQVPSYGRIVRTSTLALKNSEFVIAERSLGASWLRIVLRHILPNVIGPLFILASMDIPTVVTLEAGLSFLGFGVRPPTPSWGRILNEGYTFIRQTPWIVIAGGIPLIITTLGFTFLGEALRDSLDPRLRLHR